MINEIELHCMSFNFPMGPELQIADCIQKVNLALGSFLIFKLVVYLFHHGTNVLMVQNTSCKVWKKIEPNMKHGTGPGPSTCLSEEAYVQQYYKNAKLAKLVSTMLKRIDTDSADGTATKKSKEINFFVYV